MMTWEQIQDIVFLVVGLFIMILSLVLGKRLGERPVELKFDKLGGFFMKGDIVSLVFLVGLVLLSVGIYFRIQNYESRVDVLGKTINASNASLTEANKALLLFREYELKLQLAFDTSLNANPTELNYSISKKVRNDEPEEIDVTPKFPNQEIWLTLPHIKHGEIIRVIAKKDNLVWISDEITVPPSKIQLRKQE